MSSRILPPNFAPDFPQIFRGFFVLRFMGDGDQKKITKKPRHFSMQNSQANTKNIHKILLESRQSNLVRYSRWGCCLECALKLEAMKRRNREMETMQVMNPHEDSLLSWFPISLRCGFQTQMKAVTDIASFSPGCLKALHLMVTEQAFRETTP